MTRDIFRLEVEVVMKRPIDPNQLTLAVNAQCFPGVGGKQKQEGMGKVFEVK